MLTIAGVNVGTVTFWAAVVFALGLIPFAFALTRLRLVGLAIILVLAVIAIAEWASHSGTEEEGGLHLFYYLLAAAIASIGWTLGLLASRLRDGRRRDSR